MSKSDPSSSWHTPVIVVQPAASFDYYDDMDAHLLNTSDGSVKDQWTCYVLRGCRENPAISTSFCDLCLCTPALVAIQSIYLYICIYIYIYILSLSLSRRPLIDISIYLSICYLFIYIFIHLFNLIYLFSCLLLPICMHTHAVLFFEPGCTHSVSLPLHDQPREAVGVAFCGLPG